MSIIKNKTLLAKTKSRELALAIVEAGLKAIQTKTVLAQKLSFREGILRIADTEFNLNHYEKIGFLGIGKCAFESAKFFEELLQEKLVGGVALDVVKGKLKRISSFAGSHPFPSAKNIKFTQRAIEWAKSLNPARDLLIAVISGGGSSLFFSPEGITLAEMRRLTLELQKSQADIYELNTVRKHLSAVKGGKLAKLLYPLPILCLVFSDVIGDDLSFIASGPLVKDNTTNSQAKKVLQKYGLWEKYQSRIKGFSETVKAQKYFKNIHTFLILNNQTALEAMARKAEELGLRPKILTHQLACLNFEAFQEIKKMARRFNSANLFLAGGETKVNITGSGKGGRNLEATLASLLTLSEKELFLAFASDGRDNTDFAGAIGDSLTLTKAKKLGLSVESYLKNNDSYHFFKKTGDYLKTGPTGSNVADLMLYYRG